jgi:hypothetical protein
MCFALSCEDALKGLYTIADLQLRHGGRESINGTSYPCDVWPQPTAFSTVFKVERLCDVPPPGRVSVSTRL